jgi:hypothetical protein
MHVLNLQNKEDSEPCCVYMFLIDNSKWDFLAYSSVAVRQKLCAYYLSSSVPINTKIKGK